MIIKNVFLLFVIIPKDDSHKIMQRHFKLNDHKLKAGQINTSFQEATHTFQTEINLFLGCFFFALLHFMTIKNIFPAQSNYITIFKIVLIIVSFLF